MRNPFHVIKSWKPGDLRQIPEALLEKARFEGRFDSYSQVYEMDGRRWKVRSKVNRPTGETLMTLVCVDDS